MSTTDNIDSPTDHADEDAAVQLELDLGLDTSDNEASEEATGDSENETAAGAKGWVPKSKFKGDPSAWVDAETFLVRGQNFTKNLQRDLAEMKQKLSEFEGTKAAFAKFQHESMAAKDAELTALIRALKRERNEAIRNGEDNEADAFEARISSAETSRAETKQILANVPQAPAAAPAIDPTLRQWISDNPWYEDSPKMQAYANEVGQELKRQGDSSYGSAFLAKVKAVIMEDFPQKFQNGNRGKANSVERGAVAGGAAGGIAGRRVSDLPAKDRVLMKSFVAEGYCTEAQFLKDYQW